MESPLISQMRAALAKLRALQDSTPSVGLRILLMARIEEIEAILAQAERARPKPVSYYIPKRMRRAV